MEQLTFRQTVSELSGRFYSTAAGTMDTEMVREFFYAVSYSAAMNLHLKILDAGNNHSYGRGFI